MLLISVCALACNVHVCNISSSINNPPHFVLSFSLSSPYTVHTAAFSFCYLPYHLITLKEQNQIHTHGVADLSPPYRDKLAVNRQPMGLVAQNLQNT